MIVKICGITNVDDALAAIDAGATAIGLNFYAKSKRYVSLQQAKIISQAIGSRALKVGVFVSSTPSGIKGINDIVKLDVAQLHGDHGIQRWRSSAISVWRAFPVSDNFTSDQLDQYEAEAFLLDTPTPEYGGSGQTYDWNRIRNLKHNIVVAGGLDASNVAQSIQLLRPWGVDACSRLESSPGIKDHQKVKDFITAALSASQELS